jgi:hypothetical protein
MPALGSGPVWHGAAPLPKISSAPQRGFHVRVLCLIFQSQLIGKASLSQSLARGCRSLIASKGECSLHPNCGELTLAPKNWTSTNERGRPPALRRGHSAGFIERASAAVEFTYDVEESSVGVGYHGCCNSNSCAALRVAFWQRGEGKCLRDGNAPHVCRVGRPYTLGT